MNTYANIYAGTPGPYFLGVPAPTNALSVAPPAGTDETRAYVYTFVTTFGEEGPPSPPVVATGDAGTWALTNMDTVVPDAASRPPNFKINIYRTVSGGTSSNFYFVAQIDLGDTSYNDTETTTAVASNNLLESTSYIEPPTDLEGIAVMPNGYLVGWKGRRLVFSAPYRPHAWPAEYELSTEFPIVGLVVWGSTLVIGTKSQPYFGQGISPLSFTMQKLDAVEPCLSRRGMVATTAGAYYPSINGLILANSSGAKVITQDILTKEEWAAYNPESIYAAQLGLQYIAFNSPTVGFIFNPTEPQTKLVELEGFAGVEGIETDKYSGNVLMLANLRAWDWDRANTERLNWRWQSKLIQTPEPINFGAFRVNFLTGAEDISADVLAYYGAYNALLFPAVPSGTTTPPLEQTRGLNTLNGAPLGGTPAQAKGLVPSWTDPEIRQPLGGSLLFPETLLNFQTLAVRVQVKTGPNGEVKYDRVIYDENIYRLPTGFKNDLWQFNFYGNTDLYSFQVATTPRSLKGV
jgi:hypothetical protein